jgi:plastocyanin
MAAVLSSLVLAAAACGGDSNGDESEGGKTPIAGVEANNHGQEDVFGETGKVEIELDDYYFKPTVLNGTPGQRITLELKNEGNEEHNITVPTQDVDRNVAPAEEAEVVVTFPPSGQIGFQCKFHENVGMAGGLAVS